MARPKKVAEEKSVLQIVVRPEFKRDVEDLARSCGRQVSDLLLPIVAQFVELNRTRIESYRAMIKVPVVNPFGQEGGTDFAEN